MFETTDRARNKLNDDHDTEIEDKLMDFMMERSVKTLNEIPDFLQPTYSMLVRTFPKGISEEYYWIILYLLYVHFADENLALVMAAFSGKSIAMVSNDLYGVNRMKFDSKLVKEVKNMLDANGFAEWKEDVL